MGTDDQAYYVSSGLFLKAGANTGTEAVTASKLMYWFDDETTIQHVDVSGGVQLLDASGLTEGLHTIHYQVLCDNGEMTSASSSIFLRISPNNGSAVARSLRYWFDDDASSVCQTGVTDGTQTLDVTGLSVGLHTLYYQLIDSNNRAAPPVARVFLKNFEKVTEGGNRIVRYQYWLNDNGQSIQTRDLDQTANPYTLIGLLPVQKEPVLSSHFHFEVTDGTPVVYAENIFHIRFHDVRGYIQDGEKPFTDYSVSQAVEPVGELQSAQAFPRVGENDIRWYTIQAAPGDTVAFKLSQPATLQLFSPSGKEVFKTSESASVNWGGIHTWEDGTYYLAVHDVTGSQPNMTLDYMHMDKYDVVDWDVHTVGNGGCSTITFKGNGFRDLYAVDLFTAVGDSIHSVDVSHDSDAETAVTFDFTDAKLGVYDAVFHFTEEDRHVANVVTVEDAVDIELATTVTYPSTFLRGTTTTYTISLRNKGNMTAYNVPVFLYFDCPGTGLPSIKIRGAGLPSLYDYLDTDGLTDEEKRAFKDLSDNLLDSHLLIPTGNNNGRSTWSGIINVSVSPESAKNIVVNADPAGMISVYASAPDSWDGLTNKKENLKHKYCCIHDQLECFLDGVAISADAIALATLGATAGTGAAVSAGAKITGCVANALGTISSYTSMLICDTDKPLAEKILSFNGLKTGLSTIGTLASCGVFNKIKKFKDFVDAAENWSQAASFVQAGLDCVPALTQKPDCYPAVYGGSSTPVPPADPNDIYGYLSEAGSKFIADSVAKVNYTIEFENDTAFATAAAHTIVIKDTLDSRYFDLEAFLPTSIKLGEREVFLNEAEDVKTVNGVTTFLKTIDVRPEINAIAQVEGTYGQQTGIAEWRFTSLDPMTMEPTDDLMQGILPVNYDGTSGIGEVMFQVGVKPNKGDGTEIPNRAGIVFDYEEAIMTPTWVNTVDAVAPVSTILGAIQSTDSTLVLRLAGEDERSGVWKYNVYAQMGKGAMWVPVAENLTDSLCEVRIYEDIEYGFCVVATDSAGNVERKEMTREFELTTCLPGDANGDGKVSITDAVYVVNYILGQSAIDFNVVAADVNGDGKVSITDAVMIVNIILGQGKTAQANALPEP